jgi:AcrR family transcriptional regulator
MPNNQAIRMTRDLQRALLELLTRQAFTAITTQQIADAALIHRTTFYAHYADKFALLNACLQTQFAQIVTSATDLTTAPFATLAKLCANELAPVVVRQRDDAAFQSAMMHLFFRELSRAAGVPQSLPNYMTISRVKAVVHWVRETHQPYNIYTAGSELDTQMNQAVELAFGATHAATIDRAGLDTQE